VPAARRHRRGVGGGARGAGAGVVADRCSLFAVRLSFTSHFSLLTSHSPPP
jgi:hypothetical protein